MLPTLTSLLWSILTFLSDDTYTPSQTTSPASISSLHFELRHLHAVSSGSNVIFADVPAAHVNSQDSGSLQTSYTLRTRSINSYHPPSFSAYSQARTRSIKFGQSEDLHWESDEILAPDVESRETLLELAKMTNNAYLDPDHPDWYNLSGNWTVVSAIHTYENPSTLRPCTYQILIHDYHAARDGLTGFHTGLSLRLGTRR